MATNNVVCLLQIAWVVVTLRCILVYAYRLILHPLHSYPGPLLAKLTDWYGAYQAIRRRLHIVTYRDHQKWGPVVRQGPNKLVFNTVQAVHDIYHNESLTKSRAYLVTQASPSVYNLFNVVDKTLHRTRRRIVAQGINDRATHRFEPIIQEQIDVFLKQIRQASKIGEPVDMTERCKMFTLDLSGELSFGRSFGLQTSTTYHWLPKGLSTSNWRINVYIQFPAIKYSGWEKLLLPVLLPKVRRFHKMVTDMVQARMEKKKDAKPDLFANISDYKDPETGTGLTQKELWSEATFLIPAGGDTLASLLAALFFYLTRYPDVHTRLTTELRSMFPEEKDITAASLAKCTYLRACIDETLRISSPSNTTLWRDVPSDASFNPIIIDGHTIPPGTRIGTNIYALHHNAAYFASPFTFRPERWIPAESGLTPQETKTMHEAFIPFSRGARNCAGIALAYAAAGLVVGRVVWGWGFEGTGQGGKQKGMEEEEEGRPGVFRMEDQVGSRHWGPVVRFWEEGRDEGRV